MITPENLQYLFSIKGEALNKQHIFTLFNKKKVKGPDGKITIGEPMFYPQEEITVKAGQLPNLKEDIKTRVGLYIFNMSIVSYAFGDVVPYINYTIKKKQADGLTKQLCNLLLMDKITSEQFAKYQERIVWFNNFTEILIPGLTLDLVVLPQEIKDELQRLIVANKEAILKNDTVAYINNVEKPIIKFAEKWYVAHKDEGWPLYGLGGKPKFGNNFKNMFLATGPIYDIATGKYHISTRCLADGISPEEYNIYANSAVSSAYNRGVQTQYAGAKTKEFASAFQSLVIDPDLPDCGSKKTLAIEVTNDNIDDVMWRWIEDGKGGFILVTPDIADSYIGKTVRSRSAMLCDSKDFCASCVGDLFKRIAVENVGLTLMKLTSIFLNKFLKSMHDATVGTSSFDPFEYIYEV